MNDAVQLLDEARRLGFVLSRDGDRLHVEGPPEAEWFVEKLAEAKPKLLDALAKTERVHCIVLLGEPYPDEPDNDDPDEGKRIIAAVESAGGWLRMWEGKIVFNWRGEIPNAGELIDRIRANRIGVVAALNESHAAGL